MTYFIRNPKVGYVVSLIVLTMGLFAAVVIPKENFPNISFGKINISTVYSGVSAVDIDQLITKKIENAIKSIDGIDKINSTSRNSVSAVTVTLDPNADTDKALTEIRSEIDEVKSSLPGEIDQGPNILEIDTSLTPILFAYVSGNYSALELSEYADDLKEDLEDVPNVAKVSSSNNVEREIVVEVDRMKLESYNLTTQEVMRKISSSHRDVPLGDLDIDGLTYSLRFAGKHESVEDIENVVLKNLGQDGNVALVHLKDVAEVSERGEKNSAISRIFVPKDKYIENAVTLTISKNEGTNIFNVADNVRSETEKFAKENFPKDLKVVFSRQADKEVKRSYSLLLNSMVTSILVVMALIFLLVGFKEGLIAGIVIPLAFLATIAVLKMLGSSLNFMTNFSMILALGILVDTAIVIVEGAHDFIKKGETPYRAAILSLYEFRQPLISGTLTTLAVFVPLFSLPGTMGKFLTFIPITVFIVLTASLFISLFLITLFSSQFLNGENPEKKKNAIIKIAHCFRVSLNKVQNKVISGYGKIVNIILKRRFLRLGLLYLIIISFAASWLIPVQFVLFPEANANFFQISIKLPTGTVKELVNDYVAPIEKELIPIDEIELINTSIHGNSANLFVELTPKEDREKMGMRNSRQIAIDLQKSFKKYDGAEIQVKNPEKGPPSEAPIVLRVIAENGEKIDAAEKVAHDFKETLQNIKGATGVTDDIDKIPGEINYTIDREKALAYGIDPDQVFLQIRTILQGSTAAVISRGTKDIDVKVKYKESDVDSLDEINNIMLLSRSGANIPLKEIAGFEINSALNTLKRVDRDISFTISSLVDENGNAREITSEFLKRIKDYTLPEGVKYLTDGENERSADLLTALGSAFLAAMFVMFLILVIQFNSYSQPLLILSTIIFANIGVNAGLFLTGTKRGLPVILGFIALAGVVVNDAIILIDQINRKRKEAELANLQLNKKEISNSSLIEVIAESGRTRFNPIILTTLTTVAGIYPLIAVDTFWAGLSYTVIFGLVVASFLTLFVTPVMYYQFQREKVITFLPFVFLATAAGAAALLLRSSLAIHITIGVGLVIISLVLLGVIFRFMRRDGIEV